MAISTCLRIGTKSIRSKADLEDYVRHFNRDDKAEYTAYYAKDAVFRFSGFPDRSLDEFMAWADQIHAGMRETLNIQRIVFSPDVVVAELHTEFRGINGYETDNLAGRWGPVWEGNGPLVKMFIWYHLDKDGHICLLTEDAYVIKEASRDVIRSRDDMDKYLNAFNTNDFDVFPRYYAQDVVISLDSKQTLEGKDEVVSFFRNVRNNILEEVDIQSIILDQNAVAIKSNIKFTAIVNIEDILQFGSGVRKGGGYETQFLIYYELNTEGKIHKITAAHSAPVKIFNPWKQS
ncbi:hypothetical protein IWW34DRAFT_759354 [Fusarium oxysporum f. sp. albedinis]|nr:hypothetical protein BKA60DRAFT_527406 [Fusarium oxysporum]KAI3572775.1 hypothetical protein IWW34DRAFT_759354 [Fusarium oxysporum f. sp. albedinis]KAJ0157770.1 Nitrogen assimilation transcription factor nit-4 [Fusarium oxysporum f. sp. albedinis]KAK2470410.1 hypothetical protein H9L39_18027 [Fusarium oxysporum f. sp. albedinis]